MYEMSWGKDTVLVPLMRFTCHCRAWFGARYKNNCILLLSDFFNLDLVNNSLGLQIVISFALSRAWREHTDQGSSQHTCTHPGLKHSIKKGNWVRDICTEQEDLPLIPWLRWYQQQEWTIFLIAHDCIVNTAFGETLTVLEWMCVTIFRHSKNNYGDPCLCCFDAAEHPKPVHCANPFDTRWG